MGLRFLSAALFAAVSLFLVACGSETKPTVDAEIRVEVDRFFPRSVAIAPGGRVKWVNVMRRSGDTDRTIRNGTGPEDPEVGTLFERALRGFDTGEAEGESFIHIFPEFGEVPYFTQRPDGTVVTGTVTIR